MLSVKRIDAHQHFWKFDPVRDSWINEDMKRIRTDFLPDDLGPVLRKNGFDGCVAVQSDQSEMENVFHLQHAERHDFIKGIVGWVDLQSPAIEERLQHYRQFPKMKGFRHVLQGEPQRDLMLQPAFMKGISLLNRYGFSYDLLIYRDQLPYLPAFASAFPDQRLVIDHIAKPDIRSGDIEEWSKDIRRIAAFENVCCKLSGMVTEASWDQWSREDFRPYMDVVVEAFGTGRLLFGSDWPVCLVAASYEEVVGIVEDYFSSFSEHEKEKIFGRNAIEFYQL